MKKDKKKEKKDKKKKATLESSIAEKFGVKTTAKVVME